MKATAREQIITAMINKNVDNFWAQAAIDRIQGKLANNSYFVADVKNIRVTLGRFGYAKRITFNAVAYFPLSSHPVKGVYTFDEKQHDITFSKR